MLLQSKRFPFSLALAIAASALIANACSSDDDDDNSGSKGGASSSTGGKSSGGSGTKGGQTGTAGEGPAATGGSNAQAGETSSGGTTSEGGSSTAGGQGEGGANGSFETYVAVLSGAEETAADPAHPVDTTATGTGTFTYDPATHLLTYIIKHDVENATAGHIHDAPAGENGSPIIPFDSVDGTISGSAELSSDQESDLRLGHLYANIHTQAYANGEIRGQILHPGDTLWLANLTGAQETPSNDSAGSGVVSLIVNGDHTAAHYHLSTSLTATMAHIHTGIAGVKGDVAFPFVFGDDKSIAEGDLAFSDDDAAVLADGGFYANVHTSAFAGGEIRGQLVAPGERVYAATLDQASEPEPDQAVASTAKGNAQFILSADGTALRYQSVVMDLTGAAQASHIHKGKAHVDGPVVYPLTLVGDTPIGTQDVTATDITNLAGGGYYVNIHTEQNPDGEIRGQIEPVQ